VRHSIFVRISIVETRGIQLVEGIAALEEPGAEGFITRERRGADLAAVLLFPAGSFDPQSV